tara:strand:+ start:10794 stop:12119 length:1326 start_codon:yes stop_codon:yes gene_type:complete
MVDLIKKNFLRPLSFIDFYVLISAVCGLFLFTMVFHHEHSGPDFFHRFFFLTTFTLINCYVFSHNFLKGDVLHSVRSIGPFLLGQVLCLWGHSLEIGSFHGLLLSFIPLMTLLYIIETDLELESSEKTNRALATFLFFTVLCSISFFKSYEVVDIGSYYFKSFLAVFFAWNMSIGGLSHFNIHRDNKKFLMRFFKKSGQTTSSKFGTSQKDKFFFHDIINLTHGLNLFLGNKITKSPGLTKEETMEVLQEIKTLQSLVKDHYQIGHKNLVNSYNVVNFEFAKGALFSMIENYLPSHLVDCRFVFTGHLSDDSPMEVKQQSLVYYPTLYRVLNNLVKNISESKTDIVEFQFGYDELGLSITIKNNIYKLDDKSQELAQDLSDIILDFKDERLSGSGIGLESVTRLCEESGGKFSFRITGGQWVSEVFLPHPHANNQSLRKLA